MRTLLNTIFFIVLLVLLITFAVNNNNQVEITYYGVRFAWPAYLLVFLPFFFGVLCGNLLDVLKRYKLKKEVRRLRRELEKAEQADFT